jgi:hypothetical protein
MKILGARRVTSHLDFEDLQILGATVQNLGTQNLCTPELNIFTISLNCYF